MRASTLTLACGLALAAGVAQAAEGPYVSVHAGLTFLPDADLDGGFGGEVDYEPGVNLGAALGYTTAAGIRVEGELTARYNELDRRHTPGASSDARGDTGSLALMANAFYDIPTNGPLVPYVGGGVGVAAVYAEDWVFGRTLVVDEEDDAVLAWQLAAGLGYRIASGVVAVEYRYFAARDPDFEDLDGDDFESEYKTHNLSVSYRLEF